MGRVLLIARLAARDLRRRPAEAVMVLLVIAAAATTLTVGLALNGVTSHPYQQTRAATAGPDVIANAAPAGVSGQPAALASLTPLIRASGVTGHSGPYPLAYTVIRAGGHTVDVTAEGRDLAPARVDQPELTQGSWVRPGGVVVERGFADALGVHAGDRVTLGGRSLRVAGIAVTAGIPAYPSSLCHLACAIPRLNDEQFPGRGPRYRPGLAHPAGCRQSRHLQRSPVLPPQPEAGEPGASPGVRHRAPHHGPGRLAAVLLAEHP
jgi:hypothetical protein